MGVNINFSFIVFVFACNTFANELIANQTMENFTSSQELHTESINDTKLVSNEAQEFTRHNKCDNLAWCPSSLEAKNSDDWDDNRKYSKIA